MDKVVLSACSVTYIDLSAKKNKPKHVIPTKHGNNGVNLTNCVVFGFEKEKYRNFVLLRLHCVVCFFFKVKMSITNGTIFKPVTHVIFDLDGLLLDSEKCYHKIDSSVVEKYGKTYPKNVKEMIRGFTDLDAAKKIIEVCHLPITPEQYDQEFNQFLYLLEDCELMPGAERLIRHLSKHNILMGIATSSSTGSVQRKIKKHRELFDLVDHFVMGSSDPEVVNGKPHPDVFLVCAKRFPGNPDPEKCLVFEDAPSGVAAANKAGMQVVMVPFEDVSDPSSLKNATLVIKSLLEFVPEKFGLPAF